MALLIDLFFFQPFFLGQFFLRMKIHIGDGEGGEEENEETNYSQYIFAS